MKNYVLTGGPGTGKSSILNFLEIRKGEYIVREAAEDYIKLRQMEGQPQPWTEPDFQEKIMDLQLDRKRRLPSVERVFFDRGIADGLAYAPPGELYERILAEARRDDIELVFLVETLGQTQSTGVRRENHQEAVELGDRLELIYRSLGYEPIRIPSGTVVERAEMILRHIR